jgi:class 3 adenylate cyclase/predicted ATPase
MTFDEVLDQVRELLQQRGRVTYRSLKLRYQLDDELLTGVIDELISAERVAADEDGKVLVWTGGTEVIGPQSSVASPQPLAPSTRPSDGARAPLHAARADGERRQLTVMFIDLVGSTTLSQQLDPEDYHARVVAYQAVCRHVVTHYEGHIAQYLGDGVLVYFGYPQAHEEDAVRAVRSALEIVTAVRQLAYTPSLQVRIGIHTGPVVVGEIGAGKRTERLALGETPNIAARIQGTARPDEVVISAATYRLVEGLFEYEERGQQELKGVATLLTLYRVVKEGEAQSRFQVVARKGLTPLVGREHEYGLLRERWERAKRADGQVIMLSGEPGIGKSRLVEMLKAHVGRERATRIEFRSSPYYQNSALYPVIDHLQRVLQFERDDAPVVKLAKLQRTLSRYRFPQRNTLPLLATLLSLPHPAGVPPLQMSPQKQKEQTLETLVKWLGEEADKQPVYCAWEDLHWADPSSLDTLSLLLDQVPTARMLVVLTFRPEFTSPWGTRSHLNHLTLTRLTPEQAAEMVCRVPGGQTLSPEVVRHVIAKTDGVPLFLEELTKAVVEAGVTIGQAPLHAIPATLLDSLTARLDRLGPAKEILQWGATLGREFSYEVLQAVSGLDEERLQQGLKHVVAAELVYQSGLPPQARYLFKHALVQDAAYQSLLKSTRQQMHQRIAEVLEERFTETKATQPELLAHHYTEAGLIVQAIPLWQQAGQSAAQRSANVEAIAHLTKGLELVSTLPDTPERSQHELAAQATLGPVLIQTRGWSAPETGAAYLRAVALCQQLGETAQHFPVLYGTWAFQLVGADYQTARKLGEQLLHLAEKEHDPALLVEAHFTLGLTLLYMGEVVAARKHCEQGVAHYDAQRHRALAIEYGHDPAMSSLIFEAKALWLLGYPEQSLRQSQASVTLAQGLAHPFSLVYALGLATVVREFRRERDQTHEQAETTIALATEQGFPFWVAFCTVYRGRVLGEHGHAADGIAQMRWGIAAMRETGSGFYQSCFLALLAEAYQKNGQVEEGLATAAEALAFVDRTEERFYEAELYRIKGELTLAQSSAQRPASGGTDPRLLTPDPQGEAEACFLKAIEIAQRQQAKSLELRAVMSLSRLWQNQGKRAEAHHMLSKIYNWFTEGFDTRDLQEAKTLLEELTEETLVI